MTTGLIHNRKPAWNAHTGKGNPGNPNPATSPGNLPEKTETNKAASKKQL